MRRLRYVQRDGVHPWEMRISFRQRMLCTEIETKYTASSPDSTVPLSFPLSK